MKALAIGVLLGAFLSFAVRRRQRAAAIGRERAAEPRIASGGASGRPHNLEDLTKDELYRHAQEEDIPGRSKMSKDELIKALRQAHGR